MGPQFYEVSGNGATGYLFGTVHLSDERTQRLPAVVESAFQRSDSLFVEMKPDMAGAMAMLGAITLPKGESLDALMGEADWNRIGDRYELSGQPRAAANALKTQRPWVPLSQIAFLKNTAEHDAVLDLSFSRRAKKEGKSVHGLESVKEQLVFVTDLSLEQQAEWLSNLLDRLDEYDEQGRDMTSETLDAWASGDPELLYGLRDQVFDIAPVSREELERKILWVRNARFAAGIHEALRGNPDEVAFVAIGAMHLPSPPEVNVAEERAKEAMHHLGVADLLRMHGYSVKRISAMDG
jgi:uncharacterized protein YbaP (TraB family)